MMSKALATLAICLLLASCAATVPLATAEKDQAAKYSPAPSGKSKVYVIRTCPWAGKLHDVAMDGGSRIALACKTYALFTVEAGNHVVSAASSENREVLRLQTAPDESYYIDMGWRVGTGTGDLRVSLGLMGATAGKLALNEAQLVSDE